MRFIMFAVISSKLQHALLKIDTRKIDTPDIFRIE